MPSILQQRNWRLSEKRVAYSKESSSLQSSTIVRRIIFPPVMVLCANHVPEGKLGRQSYGFSRGAAAIFPTMKRGSLLPVFGTRQVTLNETPPTLPWNLPNPNAISTIAHKLVFLRPPLTQLGSLTPLRSPSSAPGALAQPNSSPGIALRSSVCMTLHFLKASHPRSCL